MTRTPLARLASLAAGAAMIGGCASAQPPAVDRPPAPRSVAYMLLQTPAYQSDSFVQARARFVLVRRCMAERGFAHDVATLPAPPAPAPPPPGGGYGVYERLRDTPAGALASARRSRGNGEPRGYRRALDGTGAERASVHPADGMEMSYRTGGCEARAIAELHGSLAGYYTSIARQNALVTRTLARMPDDRKLQGATTAWQRCMRRRGRRFESPAQAREAVLARYLRSSNTERAHAIELRTAASDRACARMSGVYREQRRAERAVVAAVSRADVAVLEQLARSRRAATARARAVIRRTTGQVAARAAHTGRLTASSRLQADNSGAASRAG